MIEKIIMLFSKYRLSCLNSKKIRTFLVSIYCYHRRNTIVRLLGVLLIVFRSSICSRNRIPQQYISQKKLNQLIIIRVNYQIIRCMHVIISIICILVLLKIRGSIFHQNIILGIFLKYMKH
jgi:hypothetical protein